MSIGGYFFLALLFYPCCLLSIQERSPSFYIGAHAGWELLISCGNIIWPIQPFQFSVASIGSRSSRVKLPQARPFNSAGIPRFIRRSVLCLPWCPRCAFH